MLTTVTASETEAGVPPETTLPKLTEGRSSAIERTGWISMSTAALWEMPELGGGGAVQPRAGLDEFRGVGAEAEKSVELSPLSVQPPSARKAAVVLFSAAAAPAPS